MEVKRRGALLGAGTLVSMVAGGMYCADLYFEQVGLPVEHKPYIIIAFGVFPAVTLFSLPSLLYLTYENDRLASEVRDLRKAADDERVQAASIRGTGIAGEPLATSSLQPGLGVEPFVRASLTLCSSRVNYNSSQLLCDEGPSYVQSKKDHARLLRLYKDHVDESVEKMRSTIEANRWSDKQCAKQFLALKIKISEACQASIDILDNYTRSNDDAKERILEAGNTLFAVAKQVDALLLSMQPVKQSDN